MKKSQYNKLVAEMHEGMNEIAADMGGIDPAEFIGEIATDTLHEQPEVGVFLKAQGVRDVQGRLADDFYCGRGF
jgi:hypothetical protein